MKPRPIRDLYVEQLRLGELPEADRSFVEADASVGERLRALEVSDREILDRYPPEATAASILDRMAPRTFPSPFSRIEVRKVALLAAATVITLAGVFSVILPRVGVRAVPGDAGGVEVTRIKGMDPYIAVYRKTGSAVEKMADGTAARENDLLQIRYNAAGRLYGAILSIDGRGVVTLHHPASEAGSLVLKREGEVALDFAYRLDDAPGFERFFFVTGKAPFPLASVIAAADALAKSRSAASGGRLHLPSGLEQMSVVLHKEAQK